MQGQDIGTLTHRAWLNCAAIAFQHSILWNGPVTPSAALFDSDGLRPVPFIVADLVTVAACLAMAVALEFTGAPLGLCIAVASATLGLGLFSASQNAAMLSAGQVFYSVGFTGIRLVIDVLVADTAPLRNRALAYGLIGSPWAITAFAVPAIRKRLDISSDSTRTRYAIAAFAAIVPLLGTALVGYLWHQNRNSVKSLAKGKIRIDLRALRVHDVCVLGLILLILFVFLWLVQMGVLPWYAALIALCVFFAVVAWIALSRSPWVMQQRVNWCIPWLQRNLPAAPMAPAVRDYLIDIYNHPKWERSPHRLQQYNPLKSRTMWAVCVLGMIWKCRSSNVTWPDVPR